MRWFLVIAVAAATLFTTAARAGTFGEYATVAFGVNGMWRDGAGSDLPQDFEAGAALSVALHERLKLIGDGYWGFTNAYLRGDAGAKVVVSDKQNQDNLAIYLVGKYRAGSTARVRPDEWAFGAGAGFRPLPADLPLLTLGIEAARGATSDIVDLYVAARWALPIE